MKRLRTDDRGQVTTALVVVGTVLVFALAMAASRLGQATDQKSEVQSAADAAALAGAQQIAKDAPDLVVKLILSKVPGRAVDSADPRTCIIGQDSASRFASQNGARLIAYCYKVSEDTVGVSVESLSNSVSGLPAKATAEAQVGVGSCAFPEPEPPTPTPDADPVTPPDPVPNPPSPPDVSGDVTCGDVVIPFVFDGASDHVRLGLSDGEISDLFTPALKS